MNSDNFDNLIFFNIFAILFLVATIEMSNIVSHTKMVNKINEISEKVGIECNVKTNNFIFTSTKLK